MSSKIKGLTLFESIAIVSGIVIGAGFFKTPSIVAQSCSDMVSLILVWVFGGIISLFGALCYAELSSTYPGQGGDYHFLFRAYGLKTAFLFAWARLMVIQTGSIAMLGFIIGDYASEIFKLGDFSSSIYATLIILLFTMTNILGLRVSSTVQKFLFLIVICGLLYVAFSGFFLSPGVSSVINVQGNNVWGKAMIFVLLTYGGWNEAAFLSAEIKDGRKNIIRVFIFSIAIITFIYLIMNLAFVHGMGFMGLRNSTAAAADLMRDVSGNTGASIISFLVVLASMGTLNAVIFTGARSTYILGSDFTIFRYIYKWEEKRGQPVRALILQAFIALLLVIAGTSSRDGFVLMVEYTAPVFWLFLFLTGVSLFILRKKDYSFQRPFKTPFYPMTPLLFCFFSLFMLSSSVLHSGKGALAGLLVLVIGLPFLWIRKSQSVLPE
ncbi:MAG TPA: amino acid permease [Chitinispirillaceae bacterium]|nr:amino acid permease [Chitinispirillaceae bacterium]